MPHPTGRRRNGQSIIANRHGYSRVEGHSFEPALVIDI